MNTQKLIITALSKLNFDPKKESNVKILETIKNHLANYIPVHSMLNIKLHLDEGTYDLFEKDIYELLGC